MPRLDPLVFAWVLVLALTLGCQKAAPAKLDAGPAPMPPAEVTLGDKLCGNYVARLCACAGDSTELQQQCQLAKSQPEALGLHHRLLAGEKGELNDRERRMTEAAIRKTVAACIKADGALDLDTCPRSAAAAMAL